MTLLQLYQKCKNLIENDPSLEDLPVLIYDIRSDEACMTSSFSFCFQNEGQLLNEENLTEDDLGYEPCVVLIGE